MSKTYFGRCAAVGIAGLTAMSSIAIVASAATQASLIYELEYLGRDKILMNTTVGYANGTNKYCVRPLAVTVGMESGFNVDFTNGIVTIKPSYNKVTVGANNTLVVSPAPDSDLVFAWDGADFSNVSSSMSGTGWIYKAPLPGDPTSPVPIALPEIYADRTLTGDVVTAFKTDSDRTAAKNTIVSELKKEYTTLASAAQRQFSSDMSAAATKARERLQKTLDQELKNAKDTLGTNTDATSMAIYNAAVQTAQNKYSACLNAINTSSSVIVSEFNQTFNSGSFNYELGFKVNNAPIQLTGVVGGYSPTLGATFSGFTGTDIPLDNARYWNGTSMRDVNDANAKTYVFKGEIQPSSAFTGAYPFVYLGNTLSWINYEVIDNVGSTGGNTTPSGGTTTGGSTGSDNTTTTTTTWYPDSAAYRSASEVSYLGENGSWYTSASAAATYGGGYTGTSKTSNYSSVNSSSDGKAIYFDSTTGSYTTTSTSYSYIVKEATTTSSNQDDPYYTYFFGNKNNTTTTTTAPAGSPAISGASKYAGWTNISAYITNRGKSGSTYTINMNEGTVVPSAVLAAAKAKNVTLVFSNKNGSKVTVKPGKVSTGSDLNVAVTYNVNDVKKSLVNKAKKVNAGTVSTAQIRVGSEGAIGGTETVTVKFSTKRAGCTVKAYRLTASGSLKKEATGTVASTGRVNLNLKNGGSYLLVVID